MTLKNKIQSWNDALVASSILAEDDFSAVFPTKVGTT
jgi:hypothetical protein